MHAAHFLTRAALRHPHGPAWIQGDTVVTFRQAEARVNRLAHALLSLGARPGDRVGMLIPNCYRTARSSSASCANATGPAATGACEERRYLMP